MGRAGRRAITEGLPALREELRADFVVVNGENASNGMGLNAEHANAIFAAGADCITLGDHAFDQRDMLQFIETEPRIIRPLNFAKSAPGRVSVAVDWTAAPLACPVAASNRNASVQSTPFPDTLSAKSVSPASPISACPAQLD
mgnify:CR=1 FL=1